jgi:hypothetical protein
LLSACKLTDQLAVIEAAMTEQPLWVTGSMGPLVPNGMLAEIWQYNMLISQTPARIKIDFDSAANADLIKINRPNPQRAGATNGGEEPVPDAEAKNPDRQSRWRDAVA